MSEQPEVFLGLSAKDLLIAGGWFLTVLSWTVANRQANAREVRKETKAEVDACCKAASQLLTTCRSYFQLSATDEVADGASASIRFELQRLLMRAERLESRYSRFEVMGACEELLESVTGGDFDSGSRPAYSASSDKLRKIESDVHFLVERLEEGFAREFY